MRGSLFTPTLAETYSRLSGESISADAGQTSVEIAMGIFGSRFRLSSNGYFMELRGPAWTRGEPCCQKKLCFVATDRWLLAELLGELAERPDCYYVKYSVAPRDGMYLGRCFLTDEHEVGLLWAEYKGHPRIFCSVQDDDFTAPFRPP